MSSNHSCYWFNIQLGILDITMSDCTYDVSVIGGCVLCL